MEYYFSITSVPDRNHVIGIINHFITVQVPEVEAYKTYFFPVFRREIFSFIKNPHLTIFPIKQLICAHQKQDASVLDSDIQEMGAVATALSIAASAPSPAYFLD